MKTCEACGQKIVNRVMSHETKEMFDKFWAEYPNNLGKKNCMKIFNTIDPDQTLFDKIMTALRYNIEVTWKEHILTESFSYIPHPQTWLNQERWEQKIPSSYQPRKTQGPMLYPTKTESACKP